ncbi:peptidoglycan-binding protein [Brachybacterium avium]|uniref:C40 family peptidase n=1 Tax=Brachybacterium avium TaxID=2017485 RepID=UPI001FE6F4CC|nr:peptidoglycan-binding protein [Brachybacterium avium]
MIDYRGLSAPVGRGVGGAAVIGAVSATAVLTSGAAATAQAPAAPAVGTVRGIAPSVTPSLAPGVAPAKKQSQFTSVKLRLGARGAAVSHLQERLNAHGSSLKVDGVFGSATLRAVRSQQSRAGIAVDGVVGPMTWGTLTGGTSTAPSTSHSQPKLRVGSRGSAVSTLQKQLNASGASLRVDGVFGPATTSAVRALQSAAGIAVDAVVGPRTWSAIGSNVRIPADSGSRDEGRTPVSGTTVRGQAIIDAARTQLGARYHWGGQTPSTGYDCSGLVHYAYNQAGMNLPRKTAKGYAFGGRVISQSEAQPGDLVAFTGNNYGHMGIYVGNGRIIDASSSRQRVVERSLWNAPHVFVTYR